MTARRIRYGTSAERRERRLRLYSNCGQTAIHEAGHAVAFVLLGIPIKYVTINPRKHLGSLGCVVAWLPILPYQELSPDTFRAASEREAVALLAGAAAEYIFTGLTLFEGCGRDLQQVQKYLLPLVTDEAELASYIDLLFTRTEAMLWTNWEMVMRVADSLVSLPVGKRTLSQAKVKAICRQVEVETEELAKVS